METIGPSSQDCSFIRLSGDADNGSGSGSMTWYRAAEYDGGHSPPYRTAPLDTKLDHRRLVHQGRGEAFAFFGRGPVAQSRMLRPYEAFRPGTSAKPVLHQPAR